MQMNKNWRLGAIATVAAAAVILGGGTAAMADPTGAPTYRALAGVGSDTIQDVDNGLASVIKDSSGNTLLIGSYDATGSATIQTKSGGATFSRPDGSGAGVNALKAAKTGTAYNGVTLSDSDVQFARSSSGATWVTGGLYSYIPLAEDAVTFATSASTTVPGDLTKADLKKIYEAADGATVTLNGTNYIVGTQSNASATIRPFLPQANSGTRKFWLSSQGINVTTIGSAVSDKYTVSGGSPVDVQEHDGSVLAAVSNAIMPFSIAQYIAQGNSGTLATNYGIAVTDRRHAAVLGKVGSVAPITAAGKLNVSFPIARPVFTVVKYSELSTNTDLAAVFQGSTAKAYTAKRPGSATALVITDFGFGDIRSGATINGVTYTAGDTTSFRTN